MSYRLRAAAARALLRLGNYRPWRFLLGVIQIVFGPGTRRTLYLKPINDLTPVEGQPRAWKASGSDPQFQSTDLYVLIPKGWCYLEARVRAAEGTAAALYIDRGAGFESLAEGIDNDPLGGGRRLVWIPATTRALRFDPFEGSGRFRIGPVTVTQASAAMQARRVLGAVRSGAGKVWALTARALRGLGAAVGRPVRFVGRLLASGVLACLQRATPRKLVLEPERQLIALPDATERWDALGSSARFSLTAERIPRGWCDLSTTLEPETASFAPRLYAELRGRREAVLVPATWRAEGGMVHGRAYLPILLSRLWWQPVQGPGGLPAGCHPDRTAARPAGAVAVRRSGRAAFGGRLAAERVR